MEKPIVVKLGTGFAGDQVEYVENGETKQRQGLCKQVDGEYLQHPFRDLVSYLCNPNEDELNCAYSTSEIELAERIEALVAQGDVVVNASKQNGYEVNDISLETIVGDKYNEIVQVEEITHQGQKVPVNSLDLVVRNAMGGGFYDQ